MSCKRAIAHEASCPPEGSDGLCSLYMPTQASLTLPLLCFPMWPCLFMVRDTHITPTVSTGWEGPISMDSYTSTSAEAAKVKQE